MTFFQDQARARQKTWLLLLLYALAVILIVLVIYIALLQIFISVDEEHVAFNPDMGFWSPGLFYGTSIGVLGLISLGTIYRMIQLAQGGIAVARSLGGRVIEYDTSDRHEKRILNIVEEVAIASGVRIPQVYLLENEPGINAFAAGYKPNSAVIGISKGSLDYLNRDELQGVIAHEFSHILNGDMRLNIRLMAILHGILMLTLAGRLIVRGSLHSGRRRREGDNDLSGGFIAVGAVLLLVGSIGMLAAKLIKMAVSRQREFLADASAVQFTRNPQGIGGALIKIGGLASGSALTSPRAEDISHLCFSNALSGFFSKLSLFSTHPPLSDRIKKIMPTFDGKYPPVEPLEPYDNSGVLSETPQKDPLQPIQDIFTPHGILQMVGTIPTGSMETTRAVLDSVPSSITEASHTPLDAAAIACTLLISTDQTMRSTQREAIRHQLPEMIFDLLDTHQGTADALPQEQRLPVLDMAIRSLKGLSSSQYIQLRLALETLIHADTEVSLFEYTLFLIFTRSLDEYFSINKKQRTETKDLSKLLLPTSRLLFAIAHFGHTNSDEATAAYEHCCDTLGITPGARMAAEERSAISATYLDEALQPLQGIAPHVQEKIFETCITCISFDKKITLDERYLLRAVAEMLECPLPLQLLAS